MKILVKVKPNSKVEKVERIEENEFVVSTNAPPTEGQANRAVVEAIADYFKIAKSRVRIVLGQTSKTKILEII